MLQVYASLPISSLHESGISHYRGKGTDSSHLVCSSFDEMRHSFQTESSKKEALPKKASFSYAMELGISGEGRP
jgi:hypothetical protein